MTHPPRPRLDFRELPEVALAFFVPLHQRHVRITTAGPVACDPGDKKAKPVNRKHPFAHVFGADRAAALCGFDDFDGLEAADLTRVADEDLGFCPTDVERLACGDCLVELAHLDDEEDRDPWENLPPIEGVRR